MSINPGRFTEPVAFQAVVRTDDGEGGYTEAWTDVPEWSQVFVEIEPLRGEEQLLAMQTAAIATSRVRHWALEGVTSAHRIRRIRDGVIMEIVAAPTYDRLRLSMELLVRESV